MEEIKRKYKDNQQQLAAETMKLYKENKVNPFASCLPLLIQMPILIALCYVLRSGLASNNFDLLYSFVKNPEHINTLSLGFIDLSKRSVIFAFLAGGSQFLQTKMMMRKKAPAVAGAGAKDENMMAMMNKQMLYVMPAVTVFIGMTMPAGLTFYWFLTTILTALQQKLVFKSKDTENKIPEVKVIK